MTAADEDDRLSRVLANTEQMVAILPAIALASNPFQSAPSLSNHGAKLKAHDFKSRLLLYHFNMRPPGPLPGLPGHHLPTFIMQCMVSKLLLESSIVEAAHILPKASSRVSLKWQLMQWQLMYRGNAHLQYMYRMSERLSHLQWGDCIWVLLMFGMSAMDFFGQSLLRRLVRCFCQKLLLKVLLHLVFTELIGAQAYHAHEIAVMYQPSLGTFRFPVLIESLMVERLADYGKSETAK